MESDGYTTDEDGILLSIMSSYELLVACHADLSPSPEGVAKRFRPSDVPSQYRQTSSASMPPIHAGPERVDSASEHHGPDLDLAWLTDLSMILRVRRLVLQPGSCAAERAMI